MRLLERGRPALAKWSRSLRNPDASFAKASAIAVTLQLATAVVLGVSSILVARALGPRQAGFFFLFSTATTTIGVFSDICGVYFSNSYFIAAKSDETPPAAIRSSVLLYGALIGLIAGGLFAFFPPLRHVAFYRLNGMTWGVLIFLNIWGEGVITQVKGLFWGNREFALLGLVTLSRVTVFAVLALSFAYGFGMRTSTVIGLAQVIPTVACTIVSVLFMRRRGFGRASLAYLRRAIRFGWRALLISLSGFMHGRADQWFVNAIRGPTALGHYGVAANIAEVLTQIPISMGLVLLPTLAGDVSERSRTRRRLLLTMGVAAVLCIPLAMAAPFIIRVAYGPAFAPTVQLIRVLLPGIVFMCGILIVNNHVSALGYPLGQQVVSGVALASNIVLNLVLLHTIGTVGASLASTISYGVWLLGLVIYLARRGEL